MRWRRWPRRARRWPPRSRSASSARSEVIDHLLIALFARGHCLFVGVPGLAKTLLISTLADALNLSFERIQFTPDLMPADITGTDVLEEDRATGRRVFRFITGPMFANLVLADEINRTPPKTQAALLQSMQEYRVTGGRPDLRAAAAVPGVRDAEPDRAGGHLPAARGAARPLHVPGRRRLPDGGRGGGIVDQQTTAYRADAAPGAVARADPRAAGAGAARAGRADHVVAHAVALARATRPSEPNAPDFIKKYVSWGAGPRASQYLILAAQGARDPRRALRGRRSRTSRALAPPVLAHRVLPNFRAEAEG